MSEKSSTTTLTVVSSLANQRPPPYWASRDPWQKYRRYRTKASQAFVLLTILYLISTIITTQAYLAEIAKQPKGKGLDLAESADSKSSKTRLRLFVVFVVQLVIHVVGLSAVGTCGDSFADVDHPTRERVEDVNMYFVYFGSMFVIASVAKMGVFPMSHIDYILHFTLMSLIIFFVILAVKYEPNLSNPVVVQNSVDV